MKMLRGLGELSRAYLLQSVRSRTALFWNLAFPQLWLFTFGFIFARGTPEGVSYLLPGLFVITLISSSFFGVSYVMVTEREKEILRRYSVTPVSALTVVLANGVRSIAMLAMALVVQGTLAWLIFDVTVASSLPVVAVVVLIGALAFVPLGLILGSVAKDMRSAPAISNLIFFPMMFLSGAAVPFFFLPGWIQDVARLLPATYLTEALQGVMVRGESLADVAGPLAVLLVTSAVASSLNSLLFRWETDQPLSAKRVAMAIGLLAAVYAGAALLAPGLRMIQQPPALFGSGEATSARSSFTPAAASFVDEGYRPG